METPMTQIYAYISALITYDLTNQATLRNWSTNLTLIDMTWGGVLGAITAASAFFITAKLTA